MLKNSDRFREIRKRLGLTQDDFGNKLGISRNYVSMIEKGREPSDTLMMLAERLEGDLKGEDVLKLARGTIQEPATPYSISFPAYKIHEAEGMEKSLIEMVNKLPELEAPIKRMTVGMIAMLADDLFEKLTETLKNKKGRTPHVPGGGS